MAALKVATFALVLAGTAAAQVTQLVSPQGQIHTPAISADGRIVAYENWDIFVRDRVAGTTEQITAASSGGVNDSQSPSLSADGRFVVFGSLAWNLVRGDTNAASDVFVHDRLSHTTERVSVSSAGREGNSDSRNGDITADGRFVAFESGASNLVSGDGNGAFDVFVRDRLTGTTERVSLDSAGNEVHGHNYEPSISADGRFVTYVSAASDLVSGDTNQVADVFVRDRLLGTTELVSVGMSAQLNWDSVFFAPSISADGRFVAFDWSNCDACTRRLFVRDRMMGTTELVSVNSQGQEGDLDSYSPYITPDGRYVAFDSDAGNLVPDDEGYEIDDMFVRDRWTGTTERVSVDWAGRGGNDSSGGWLLTWPCRNRITPDGRFVAFSSRATNLIPHGGSSIGAAYVHDRSHPERPTLCSPGFSGVIGCPCSNPPSSRDRGCDNSAGSGGAKLEIGGGEYLSFSSDSLFFTLTGATPDALAVLIQAVRPNARGAVFGQGVRCVGGTVTNLYVTSTHRDGSVVVPDFDIGDATVHQRANVAGDPILPMQTRWYMALYRDPVVLGGCRATATFNTTPTREILWLP